MLFDPEPKRNKKDFYDREAELRALLEAMERERLVVIQGIRRLGKILPAQRGARGGPTASPPGWKRWGE